MTTTAKSIGKGLLIFAAGWCGGCAYIGFLIGAGWIQ
jgi:hypothetical protein